MLKNYRPVSNLAYTGKLIEKVVLRRLNKHISDHNLGEPFQSAYRPNHSTETALMRVQHAITKELDQDRGVEQIGVTGVPLTWFKSYLSKKNQRIRKGTCHIVSRCPSWVSSGASFVYFLHHINIFYLQETWSVLSHIFICRRFILNFMCHLINTRRP